MSDTFDVTQQELPGGNVSEPASGTYGEKAALQRLEQALPKAQPVGPGAEQGAPVAPLPRMAPQPTESEGLPSVLLGPSTQPDVPASTPLMPAPVSPVAAAQSWRQRNLAILDSLAQSPTVSPETKEWAASFRDKLIQASTR